MVWIYTLCLNVKELLLRNNQKWIDCNETQTHNHFVSKPNFPHSAKLASLAKCLIVCHTTTGSLAHLLPDGESELFKILAGVLQGYTVASYIFTIMQDYAMTQVMGNDAKEIGFRSDHKRSRRHNPGIITDMDCADDIVLMT